MIAAKNQVYRQMLINQQMRNFGVLPKLPKVELTVRTPYQSFFKNFNNFTRIYVGSIKGQMAIGNRSMPRVYLLPPGQFKVQNMAEGKLSV